MLCLSLEKQQLTRFWNAAEERIHRDAHPVVIRQVFWVPSQFQLNSPNGCLFVQLGSGNTRIYSCHEHVPVITHTDMTTNLEKTLRYILLL